MPPVPIILTPGVDAQSTAALNAAGWNESGNIRFFQGLAQKTGGFSKYTEQVADAGIPSALRAWTTLAGIASLAIGSQSLISLLYASTVYNITPRTRTTYLPIALSTTGGSATVTVQDAVNSPQEGDWFAVREPVSVGGIVLHGPYLVQSVVDATHYTIESPVEAASTVANGGAARQFATTAGSRTVIVTLANHGLFTGAVVYIHDGVTVGGITVAGNYTATVVNPNTYAIEHTTAATTTASALEYGGAMSLTFLTGLVVASSASVEPFVAADTHTFRASGGRVRAYSAGGTLTYAPGNILTVNAGTGSKPSFTVATTQVVTVAIANVGSGGSPGAHTFRGSDGTGTAFEFTATVAADGTLTGATPTITVNGSYTVNPSLSGQPINDITDGTLLGATVNVGMWPQTLTVNAEGAMTEGDGIFLPANPVPVLNSGTGAGATIDVGWDPGYEILDVLSVEGGYGTAPKFLVASLEVIRIAIQDGGSGGVAGATHTFRGSSGTGTPFEFTAIINASGSLSGQDATIAITQPGGYIVAPTLFGEAINDITDGSLTGASVNISLWPETVTLSEAGHMTSLPDNPADTLDEGPGNGLGAQLNVVWSYSAGAQYPLGKEYIIFDNWGEFLVAIPVLGPVYVWQPKRGPSALLEDVGSAPQANLGGFVASQQQILVVLGTINFGTDIFDPMLVRWSTLGDYTDFVPSSTNQAGSLRLQLGSAIIAGTSVPRGNLIWTDLALYAMQYIGLPFVFQIQPIGTSCGLVGPHAFGTAGDGTTFWMSQNQFYSIKAGSSPQPIPCTIWDVVFPGFNKAHAFHVTCAVNSYFGEVSWFVPQTDGTTVRAKLAVETGVWDYTVIENTASVLDRSAWIDQNVFGPPMGADHAGNVYQEETSRDADGEVLPARLLSGIAMLADGDDYVQTTHIYPDIKFDEKETHGPGTLNMRVWLYKDPQAPPRLKGPYPINARTRRIPCRGRAKGVQVEFYSDDLGSWWRLGRVSLEGFPDGKGG